MPTPEEIKSLISQMPELDIAPPPPPEEPKPDPAKPADAALLVGPPKPKPKPKPDAAAPKGKLTGPPWREAEKIYDAILAGGKDAVTIVIDQITANDIGPAYKPRYVLHGLAVYACRPGKEKERAAIVEAILPKLTSNKSKTTRGFLIRTLQVCADQSVVSSLSPLLADEDLADPAAQAMVTLRGDAPELLRAALQEATGRPKLAIIQALGALKDSASLAALTDAANDKDENTRITALWSLARSGGPQAMDPILKATEAPDGWPRTQATKAAFVLAETLADANKTADAIKIYQHLQQTRSAEHEAHIRQAAEQALASLK
jgi:hypothetical protein